MHSTYTYMPVFKFKVHDKVYAFQENGTFITADKIIQTALEKSPPYISGEMTKKEPLRVAVKIYSPILEGYLWVVQDRDKWHCLGGEQEPVYDAGEISELKRHNPTPDELRAAHEVKKTFGGVITSSDD